MMLVSLNNRSVIRGALHHHDCLIVQEPDWSMSAALMGMAGMLGIWAKLFTAQPKQLMYEDSDRSCFTATQLLPMWMPTQAFDDSGSIQ